MYKIMKNLAKFKKFGKCASTSRTTAAASAMVETLEQRTLFTVTPDPGSDFATAFDAGNLQGRQTFNDVVGPSDLVDAYKFTMTSDGQFFGRLRTTSARADITLIREHFDASGNKLEDFVASKQANQDGADGGFASGNLQVQFLTAGTYYIFVTRLGGDTPYLMRMTADYAGNSLCAARNIGSATDATFHDFLGQSDDQTPNDPSDFYKLKMDAPGRFTADMRSDDPTDVFEGHLEIIRDANGNGVIDPGDQLFITGPGTTVSTTRTLDAGTYFVRVASDISGANYHVRFTADYAGTAPGTNRVTGSLDAAKSFNDFISILSDPLDDYQFSVTSTRPLDLVFSETGGTSALVLFKDANNNGVADPSEQVLSASASSFDNLLTMVQAGNYILRVQASSGEGTYALLAHTPADQAGNTLGTAKNLGTIIGLTHLGDFVSPVDTVDFYKFIAPTSGSVSAQLFADAGDDVDLALIRDANNNGKVDPGEIVAASTLPGNQVDQFSKSIAAGTYFLRVSLKQPDGISKYFLSFVTDFAGSTPATARNVGTLAGTKNFDDWASGPFGGVISDTADVYKFSLASSKTLTAKMTGALSGQDLDLQLYIDKNHDGVLQSNELIASSHNADSPNEQFTKALVAGTYFVKVVGINGETNYHLTLKA